MNFTAIDFETANSKRASACSIGMAKVREGVVVETFYELLAPVVGGFEYLNTTIHGITPEMVQGRPTVVDLWDKIDGFIGGDVLVAHNVSFEQSVINQSFLACKLAEPKLDYLCTLYMTKVNYPKRMGYKLDDVCKDLLGRTVNHHHALEDAVACAELAVHHIAKYREQDARALISVLYVTPLNSTDKWRKMSGIKPDREELDPTHPLYGKSVVFTGVLKTMSREKAVQMLVDCGGVFKTAVSVKTDYLVVGDEEYQMAHFGKPSNKMINAALLKENGTDIQVIGEAEYMALVAPK